MCIPAAMLVLSFVPEPAVAQNACIQGCNEEFPGDSPAQVAIRGWCYILRGCWQDET